MIKEKEKKVEVTIGEGENAKKINILVRKPGNQVLSQAQRVHAKTWTDCAREGIMTKKELTKFMQDHNIWNEAKEKEEKDKVKEINDLEKRLYVQDSKSKKLKLSEAKDIAIKMRIARAELRDLISERISLEQNTAEALADNARFDFLVANCTFYDNGQKVYNSLDEYSQESDSEVAYTAAATLAQLMYAIDKNVEANLPENRFLSKFNFVNDDLTLVDENGNRVDSKGKRIDEYGYYLNDEGHRVDKAGNLLDENGNYIPTIVYTDDSGKVVKENTGKKKEDSV